MQDKGPLYVISVASRLLALHPQTLRKYERAGFVAPSRTDGNLRLYSPEGSVTERVFALAGLGGLLEKVAPSAGG